MPSLASVGPIDEREEHPREPNLEADQGRVADLVASPGFTPDPMTRASTTASSDIDLSEYDDRCAGWASREPDLLVHADRPFAELAVMAASPADLTMMLVGPDGEARCSDDVEGTHPVVRGDFAAGLHRVWIGSHNRGAVVPFMLALTELDGLAPSSLLVH